MHTQSALSILDGSCFALFAFDVGVSIKLDDAEKLITALKERTKMERKRRSPKYFEFSPLPIKVTLPITPIQIGEFRSSPEIEFMLYDFGSISVRYTFPLKGALSNLVKLSEDLYDNELLLVDSERLVRELLKNIESAVVRPFFSDFSENFTVFQVRELEPALLPEKIVEQHSGLVARILRSENITLSSEEILDALAYRISYAPDDLVVIDWDKALIFDKQADDVVAVIDYANVALLELRYLDEQLDSSLDEAYETLAKTSQHRFRFSMTSNQDLRRVGQLQVDTALFYEGVSNALKLLGDQYLARVYRLLSRRFHLEEWGKNVLRKIDTLDSIYSKMSDFRASTRLETLEWVIIGLIAVSILVSVALTMLTGVVH